jgi:hypothetical protein
VVTAVVLVSVVHLICLHLWLGYKGLTTFEWIKLRREKSDQVAPALNETSSWKAPFADSTMNIALGDLQGKAGNDTQADASHKFNESTAIIAEEMRKGALDLRMRNENLELIEKEGLT